MQIIILCCRWPISQQCHAHPACWQQRDNARTIPQTTRCPTLAVALILTSMPVFKAEHVAATGVLFWLCGGGGGAWILANYVDAGMLIHFANCCVVVALLGMLIMPRCAQQQKQQQQQMRTTLLIC